jgi:hypothetical protein
VWGRSFAGWDLMRRACWVLMCLCSIGAIQSIVYGSTHNICAIDALTKRSGDGSEGHGVEIKNFPPKVGFKIPDNLYNTAVSEAGHGFNSPPHYPFGRTFWGAWS